MFLKLMAALMVVNGLFLHQKWPVFVTKTGHFHFEINCGAISFTLV